MIGVNSGYCAKDWCGIQYELATTWIPSNRGLPDAVSEFWGGKVKWVQDLDENPHEAGLLALDAGRATESLNWRNKLEFKNAIKWTIEWHSTSLQSRDPLQTTLDQISEFMALD